MSWALTVPLALGALGAGVGAALTAAVRRQAERVRPARVEPSEAEARRRRRPAR